MAGFNRRELGLGLGMAITLATAGKASPAPSAAGAPAGTAAHFPADFIWGCATASYQIEGAVNEDGRGQTNWDVYAHTAGKIADGSTADVACDSYHRYKDDTQLMKELGASAYRMSFAWSRIFPEGRGQPNAKGLDHYHRVIDDLLENGIQPYVTLFHWDLPEALPGGWQSRDTAYAFADYAGFIAEKFSDRVRHFMTTNELRCFTDLGHGLGNKAPGLHLPPAQFNQVRHHGVLAHGLGVQALRAHARAGTQVGIAENTTFFVPVIETPEHIAAAKKAVREENAMFLTAIMEGRYIDSYLEAEGANAPKVQTGDMQVIGSSLDFVALNVYAPNYARADDSSKGYAIVPHGPQSPHMASPWLYVGPEVAYWSVRTVSELWKPKALYISENGCSADDIMVDGRVDDADRIMYLRNCMMHFHRATSEGYLLKGYFLWSLMDNFEWEDGYTKRFGIHHVDFATKQRTPKLSAAWYKELIARNALV